jgi:hypothetical protein
MKLRFVAAASAQLGVTSYSSPVQPRRSERLLSQQTIAHAPRGAGSATSLELTRPSTSQREGAGPRPLSVSTGWQRPASGGVRAVDGARAPPPAPSIVNENHRVPYPTRAASVKGPLCLGLATCFPAGRGAGRPWRHPQRRIIGDQRRAVRSAKLPPGATPEPRVGAFWV